MPGAPGVRGGNRKYEVPPSEELEKLYWKQGRSMKQIGLVYGVSMHIVQAWMKSYNMPRRTSSRSKITVINNVDHKWCRGLPETHPGKWVPTSDFLVSGINTPRYICRYCENYRSGVEVMIAYDQKYQMWLESIVRRIGVTETSRRIGVHVVTIAKWRDPERRPPTLRRRNARKIVKVLHDVLKSEEIRHKRSIRYGATERGRKEREVTHMHDHLYPTPDHEVEKRRENRRKQVAAKKTQAA